jgi:hypothetical protein
VGGETEEMASRGSLPDPQEKGPEGGFGCPLELVQVGGVLELVFSLRGTIFLSWGQVGALLEFL